MAVTWTSLVMVAVVRSEGTRYILDQIWAMKEKSLEGDLGPEQLKRQSCHLQKQEKSLEDQMQGGGGEKSGVQFKFGNT